MRSDASSRPSPGAIAGPYSRQSAVRSRRRQMTAQPRVTNAWWMSSRISQQMRRRRTCRPGRVALRAALEAARKNGGSGRAVKPKPRTASAVRHSGREPLDLGAAIGALVTERAWELPAAGATLRERWGGHRPRARRARRRGRLRRRLRPGHGVPGVGGLGDEGPAGAGPGHRGRQDIVEAVERRTRAMRELSARAFPEPKSAPDDAPASIETARARRRREGEASRAAALRRAREERAARETGAVARGQGVRRKVGRPPGQT